VGYFCNFSRKLPKENNRPLGKHSPNLVTLIKALIAGVETRTMVK
jgi:hypothetical protein